MKVSERPEIATNNSDQRDLRLNSDRQNYSEMSDGELLRFGALTTLRCLSLRESHGSQLAHLRSQLAAARAEWNRRYSKLPLVDSF